MLPVNIGFQWFSKKLQIFFSENDDDDHKWSLIQMMQQMWTTIKLLIMLNLLFRSLQHKHWTTHLTTLLTTLPPSTHCLMILRQGIHGWSKNGVYTKNVHPYLTWLLENCLRCDKEPAEELGWPLWVPAVGVGRYTG